MTGSGDPRPPLFVVRGDATPEEVAALTVVLTALAGSGAASTPPVVSEWSAHHRKVRASASPVLPTGDGGWRSSSLPR